MQTSTGLGEVNENVAQTSKVAQVIAQDISQVNQTATDISEGTTLVTASLEELNHLAQQLGEAVGQFKVNAG